MDDCAKKRVLRKDCPPADVEEELTPCPPVAFCAGNKHVSFDGRCLTVENRAYQIPDGSYSLITFEDGCIVAVGNLPPPAYTANQCCPPAGVDSAPPGADTVVSLDPKNLLRSTPSGLIVTPQIIGRGVDVTGSGTSSDPFVITASGDGSHKVFVVSGTPESVAVTGGGQSLQDPITIGLKDVIQSGVYGPFTVNSKGQVVNYSPSSLEPIVAINAQAPLKSEVRDGIATVSIDESVINPPASEIETGPDGYGWTPEFGSNGGMFRSGDGRLVYYDATGRITQVVKDPSTSGGDTGA